VVVEARLQEQSADSVVVRFEVRDTGVGIAKLAVGRLFVPFAQAETSTARRYGGTGLGLVIAKQLVELMGGQIGVESEPNRGSTFWFTVRFQSHATQAPSASPDLALAGIRVLFVDDNATMRDAHVQRMAAWGMRVDGASGGLQALQKLQDAAHDNAGYDIVILDQKMGEMDGLDLARRIHIDPALVSTRIVLVQSQRGVNEASDLLGGGVSALLTKPIQPSDLRETLNSLFSGEAGGAMRPVEQALDELASSQQRLRILVAEDNPVHQMVVRHQLSKLGLEAKFVEDGDRAVDAMDGDSFDVVFMDCQLPTLDGYRATAEIRRRHETRVQPWIVAMTANALPEDREKCLVSGMDDYLAKPVSVGILRDALSRFEKVRAAA